MNRDYESGTHEDVKFFVGIEVEKTPAFGLKTLFVVGPQDHADIINHYYINKCEHIYLGANKSFDPNNDEWIRFMHTLFGEQSTMSILLSNNYLITLDFNVKHIEWILEECLCGYDNFIPQISVEIPYIRQLNYNAVLKIDDTDFKKSNPGVWCHNLHMLQTPETFTPWTQYKKDIVIT